MNFKKQKTSIHANFIAEKLRVSWNIVQIHSSQLKVMIMYFVFSLVLFIPIVYAAYYIDSVSIRVPTLEVSIPNGDTFDFGCDIIIAGSGGPDKNVFLHYEYCEADSGYTCTGAWGDIPTSGSTGLVISADNPVTVGNLNANYQDPEHTTTGYNSPSNYYKIRCWAQGDGDGSPVYSGTQNVEVTTPDITPPQWSQPDVNVTNPHRGESINISAVWQDTGVGLAWSWLSTNETGDWVNYTGGTHDSPRSLSGTNPLTVNFSWMNNTGKPRVIGWIMYANDTNDYENGTNSPSGVYEGNFTMWGWSNITWTSPSGSVSGTVALTCFVNDTNTTGSDPIGDYTVSFYNISDSAESSLGTNNTDSSGSAIYYWDTTGLGGTYYPKCNISNNATQYYNASEHYEANTTVSVVQAYPRDVTLALTFNSPVSNLNTYTRSSFEPLQLLPSVSGLYSGLRPVPQKLITSEQIGRMFGTFRYLTQSFSLTEAVAKALARVRILTQSLSAHTLIGRVLSGFRILTQSIQTITRLKVTSTGISQEFITLAMTITDSAQRVLAGVRSLTQSLISNSVVTRFRQVSRALTQSLSITNITSRLSSFFRILTQATSITNRAIETTINIYDRIVTVALSMSQIVSRLSFISQLISQSLNLGDIATSLRSIPRALTQVLNLTSLVDNLRSVPRIISQTLTTNTVITRVSNILRTLIQSLTGNLVAVRKAIISRIMSQSLSLTGLISTIKSFPRAIIQTLTTNTVITRVRDVLRALTQSLSITNITSRLSSFFRILTQTTSMTSQITEITFRVYNRTVSIALSMSQIVSRLSFISRLLAQSLNLGDITVALSSFHRALSQAFNLTSLVDSLRSISRIASQTLTTNTVVSRVRDVLRALTQSLTGNIVAVRIRYALRSIIGQISITGAIQRLASIARILSQSLTTNAIATKFLGKLRTITQSLALSEVSIRLASLIRGLTQVFNLTTVVSTLRTIGRALSESLGISSIAEGLRYVNRVLTQALTSNLITKRLSSIVRVLTQTMNANTLIQRLTSIPRVISQSLLTTTSVIGERVSELFGRIASIAITISDIIRRVIYSSRTVTGSFAISDVVTRLTEISRAISQSLNITGFMTRATFQIYERIVSVYLTITQLIQRSRAIPRAITQAINFNVIASRVARIYRSVIVAISLLLRLIFPCSIFFTQSSCEGAGCYWCDNACQTQPCAVATTTVPPGGGGGGGAIRGPITVAKIINFAIDKDFVKVFLEPGGTERKIINIGNTGDVNLTITVNLKNLEDFLIFPEGVSDYTFDLGVGEAKSIQLNFFASEDQEPGVFPGKVIVTGDGIEKLITIVVEVESVESMFDIDIEIPRAYKKVLPGEEVLAQLTIFNIKRVGRVDIGVEYGIKDIEGNVIISKEETLAVELQVSVTRSMDIPPDIKPGNYVVYGMVSYDDTIGTGSDIFTVSSRKVIAEEIRNYLIVIFAIASIVIVSLIFYLKYYSIKTIRGRMKLKQLLEEQKTSLDKGLTDKKEYSRTRRKIKKKIAREEEKIVNKFGDEKQVKLFYDLQNAYKEGIINKKIYYISREKLINDVIKKGGKGDFFGK